MEWSLCLFKPKRGKLLSNYCSHELLDFSSWCSTPRTLCAIQPLSADLRQNKVDLAKSRASTICPWSPANLTKLLTVKVMFETTHNWWYNHAESQYTGQRATYRDDFPAGRFGVNVSVSNSRPCKSNKDHDYSAQDLVVSAGSFCLKGVRVCRAHANGRRDFDNSLRVTFPDRRTQVEVHCSADINHYSYASYMW